MLRLEIKKVFESKSFLLSLILGMLIVLLQASWVKKYLEVAYMDSESLVYSRIADVSFLQGWIGQDPFSAYAYMFYLVLFPMLAAMPYGANHFKEHKLGYDKNVICRIGKRKYFITKYIAAFFSGGMVVTIPSVISLMWSMTWLPLIPIDLSMAYTGVNVDSLWGEIFFEHPLLYALLYIALDFVIAGVFSTCSLALTFIVKSEFQIMIFPMLINIFLVELLNYAPGVLGKVCRMVPYCYVSPYSLVAVSGWEIILSLSILMVVTLFTYYYVGRKGDVL
ncbi:MAG: hypothetical protein IJX85_05145 [Lachnospiraceae bacterium]|nr:hypothetical protein [Lachnospiraceae bacterium]